MTTVRVLTGNCLETLKTLPDESVQCCVTSPPYWGLRDYGNDGQLGLETTPDEYVSKMVAVFREVRRVLRDDGTLWLNLGDSYCTVPHGPKGKNAPQAIGGGGSFGRGQGREGGVTQGGGHANRKALPGLKHKDLVGIPWRVAFALQADGWWLRQDIIWHKPNPMPESVTDRCTKNHEYVFLLTKSATYYYDHEAVKEDAVNTRKPGHQITDTRDTYGTGGGNSGLNDLMARYHEEGMPTHRNRRSVWTVTTKPFGGAHFAVMPEALVEPCILAGTKPGDLVLDPFGGSGTVGVVASRWKRDAVLCELNPEYVKIIEARIASRGMVEIDSDRPSSDEPADASLESLLGFGE